tara:strand:+ start:582 stop:1685 length:1104 start_codon:yes stop_codon:yes gene_type:complete
MKLSYISNIKLAESSGGGSGVNNAVYSYFKTFAEYLGYQFINPPNIKSEEYKSKFQKLITLPRDYYYFSEKRLEKIKEKFNFDKNADFYFFHGFSPWIKIKPDKPYFCFNDACFATYVEIYNNKKCFKTKDLQRIFTLEKEWLQKAQAVFFRSEWALQETKKNYNITGANFFNVGVGGFINIPLQDTYSGGKDFLFISKEFLPKGGKQSAEALQIVRKFYPEVSLSILGQKPSDKYIGLVGINYLGFLNKNNKVEYEKLTNIFSKAFALVHPTIKDTNTLVINELAYFGCPAISSNKFAIPEYLINNKTGLLLENPRNVEEIASKMIELLRNNETYKQMRIATRNNAIQNNTWEKVGERLFKVINKY